MTSRTHARRLGARVPAEGARRADRRGRRPGRVSRRRRRLLRRGVPGAAGRSADDDAGSSPALVPGRDRRWRAEGSVSRGREHAAAGRTRHREERRARRDGAAARREVFLGGGSEGAARVAARAAPHRPLSQAARQLPRQGRADREAGRAGSPAEMFGRPESADRTRRARRGSPRPTSRPTWFSSSPSYRAVMGGVYAREEGEPEQVWKAIYHQYLPIGVEADAPPTRAQLGRSGGHVGRCLAGGQAGHARRSDLRQARRSPARAIRSRCGATRRESFAFCSTCRS